MREVPDREGNDVKSAFLDALSVPPADRKSYLEQRCGNDNSCIAEATVLLDSYEAALDKSLLNLNFGDILLKQLVGISGLGESSHYTIDRLIGGGGCAVVYAATRTESPQQVAIKMLRPELRGNVELQCRFRFEQETQWSLDHPNVAQVFDSGESSDGVPYLVMELLEEKSIVNYASEMQLSVSERLNLFLGVCDGVQHVHQQGIIHRDLKPANVLVTINGGEAVAKIIDFGVCKAVNDFESPSENITHAGQCPGTLRYMSPEQLMIDGRIDGRSDIFSLGVLLYEVLTGTLQFPGINGANTARIIRERIDNSGAMPIDQTDDFNTSSNHFPLGVRVKPKQKNGLERILLKALEKDPKRRYCSVSELATDIKRHLRNEPVSAVPASIAHRVSEFARHNCMAAVIGLFLMACLVCGILGVTNGMRNAAILGAAAERLNDRVNSGAGHTGETFEVIGEMFDIYLSNSEQCENKSRLHVCFNESTVLEGDAPQVRGVQEANLRVRTGVFLARLNYCREAEIQLRKAVDLYSQELDSDDDVLLNARMDLAEVLWMSGLHKESGKISQEVLDARQLARIPLDDIRMMSTTECVARCMPYAESKAIYENLLMFYAGHIGGPHHHRAIAIRHNYAMMLLENKKFSKAARELQAVVESEIQHCGERGSRALNERFQLISVLRKDGRLSDAIAVLQRICELDKIDRSPKVGRMLWLSEMKYANRDYREALRIAEGAMDFVPIDDFNNRQNIASHISKCRERCGSELSLHEEGGERG